MDYKEIQVSIKDTGKGIDPDICSRLFTYFTSKISYGHGTWFVYIKRYCRRTGWKDVGPK
jgi:signal transduction histidine kinase